MTKMGAVAAVFSAVLFAGSVTAADFSSALADIAPVCRAWEPVATPMDGKGIELTAVAAFDASNAWAVGHAWGVRGTRTEGPVAMRWDGLVWTEEPVLDLAHLGVQPRLEAVAIGPAGDPWVVGHLRDGQRGRNVALILRSSGGSWSEHRITLLNSFAARYPLLRDVAAIAENDAWVVGEAETEIKGVLEPFAAHWDGTAWSEVSVPGTAGGNRVLTAVSAAAANAVWAVGYDVDAAGNRFSSRIYRWDGREWSVVDEPTATLAGSRLRDIVALAADDVWAVGEGGTGGIFLHWDGKSWTSHPGPAGADPRSVDGAAWNDVWAAGARGFYQWDGKSWSLVPSGNAYADIRRVVAVAGPCDAWSIRSSGEAADSVSQVERLGPSVVSTSEEVSSSLAPVPVTGTQTEAEPRTAPPLPEIELPAPQIDLPPAPVSLTASAIGTRRIALEWMPGKSDGAPQEDFVIERCIGAARACQPFTVVAKVGGRITSFVDAELKPATAYTYRVYAVNKEGGRSEATAPSMAQTFARPEPLPKETGPRS